MKDFVWAWPHETPTRAGFIRGTVRTVDFRAGGGRAREVHPFDLETAIEFFDPFQPWHHLNNPNTLYFSQPIYTWGD